MHQRKCRRKPKSLNVDVRTPECVSVCVLVCSCGVGMYACVYGVQKVITDAIRDPTVYIFS